MMHPTTEIPHPSPGIINTSTSKISTDLHLLHKQVDRYTQRLKKTKNQIKDLEIELNSITPRKRARSELSKNIRKADELSNISNKISESNIILKSYESLIQKYFPKNLIQKNKEELKNREDSFQKRGNFKNLSEIKQIFKKPKPQNRQPSRLTTSRPESSLKSKIISEKPPLPPIPTAFDIEKFHQSAKTVLTVINRFFKTTDAQTIKSILENQRERKQDLQIKQNLAELKLQNYQLKKSKLETSIHNFSPIKVRDMLLITEGKVALSILSSEKDFIQQKLRDYQAQRNAFLLSSLRFCDIFDLQEVSEFEELTKIYIKIRKIINKSSAMSFLKKTPRGARSKVSFTITDLIPSSRKIEDSINSNNSVDFEERVSNIPRLSLASARGNNDFYPGTRSTRRAFNTFNSNSDFREIFSGRGNSDLQFFGKSLGNIFVDRYCFEIFKEKKVLQKIENFCEVESLSPIFVNKVNSYSCREILKSIADQYIKYQDSLYLSILSDYEISKTEKSFMQFTSIRDFLIGKFNEKFNEDLLILTYDYLINNSSDVAACWFIRDIILKSTPFEKNGITSYFEKLVPSFKKRMLALSSVKELTKSTPFIGYFACFATFLRNSDLKLTNRILSFINESLVKIMNIFTNSINSSISRCGLAALFQFGKFCPQFFYQCIEFQNKANSDFLVYLRQNIQFTTCVKESAEFFNKAFSFLSKEAVLFHTAMFFHYSINQLLNPTGINLDVVSSLLSCLITVVANRNKTMSEQLTGLGFLQFLMKNFELEAFLASNIKNNSSKLFQNSNDLNKIKSNNNNNVQFTKLNRITTNNNNDDNDDKDNENNNDKHTISYLNIPKMNLPHLNLENPKLQLHFKPYSSINRNSLRSSISNNQYIEQRSKKPIYLSNSLHVVYVQLMFALLIDHSTHRLDSFFCDPFPSVNRKPNVLFVLMMHMEGKLNQEIVEPLKEIFNTSFLQKQIESCKSIKKTSSKKSDKNTNSNETNFNKTIKNKNKINETESNEVKVKKTKFIEKTESSKKNPVSLSFEKVPSFIAQKKLKEKANNNSINITLTKDSLIVELQQYEDYMRLLRLTVPSCFEKRRYSNGYHIASGAFGAVMGVTYEGNELAVKILEKSRNECDNPHLNEVYTEVSILEICKGDRRVTQLFDYGCSEDSYYIVMENYPTTLKSWRKSFFNQSISTQNQMNDEEQNDEFGKSQKADQNNTNNEEKENIKADEIKEESKENKNKKVDEIKEESEENKNKKVDEIKEESEENKNKKTNEIKEESEENKNKKADEMKEESEENKNKKTDEIKEENKNKNTDEIKEEESEENKKEDIKVDNKNTKEDSKNNEEEEQNETITTDSLKQIRTSREWKTNSAPPLTTLLRVYREFLNCATVLTDHHINHFDIKCDNVMLDTTGHPALGDFGESMLYNDETDCTTLLNRGTEWIKSPEMLSIALDSSADSPKFDRLRRVGAGPASDVWSIGCLFFELITGEFLFIDTDWSRFFTRVTSENEVILSEEKEKMLPPDPRFKLFIEFVLQRNVRRRPNLRQVIVKFDEMFPDVKDAALPVIIRKKPPISPSYDYDSSCSGSPFSLENNS